MSEGRRTCEWTIALDASARHVCSTASDRGAGLDCVQRVDGYRSCEVRCTTRDMVCPFGHACSPPSWVCERFGP